MIIAIGVLVISIILPIMLLLKNAYERIEKLERKIKDL